MIESCDTFVVLPPLTQHGVIFGKNSDRPPNEFQEVVYYPRSESGSTIKCTYIEVEVSGPTKAVILSKPNWMWGVEMGANECGVVIGNEAVYTNDVDGDQDPKVPRLLGMDLVRLGLERSSSALEALEIIIKYLEKYGQGGVCSLDDPNSCYHNSFIIADSESAWVLETVGKHWVAEHVTSGHRNISNILTITTRIDKKSDGLLEYAMEKGLWDGSGEFNFAEVFNGDIKPGASRFTAGKSLLDQLTVSRNFKETDMFAILRDTESDICRPDTSKFPTKASQVSVIRSDKPSVHWFTATQNPSKSVFKPFVFTKNPVISKHTQVLNGNQNEPHTLYALHFEAVIKQGNEVQNLLRNMENECVTELSTIIDNLGDDLSELDELFKDCVETEVKFYR
ncbi:hypothetical protein FQR65_LT10273 [Abscondita terminalis]|nr:hypothetical protein FQR65_LT10273 [Abscondita terminalis]